MRRRIAQQHRAGHRAGVHHAGHAVARDDLVPAVRVGQVVRQHGIRQAGRRGAVHADDAVAFGREPRRDGMAQHAGDAGDENRRPGVFGRSHGGFIWAAAAPGGRTAGLGPGRARRYWTAWILA